MTTLNIIGCGKVGGALARVWTGCGVFQLRDVLNRSGSSAQRAIDFVGEGAVVEDYDQFEPADAFLIATRDEAIEGCCQRLCSAGVLCAGNLVFHCSGSLSSELLAAARGQGAHVGSVHPVKSFADSAAAAESFPGTFCAVEGDDEACRMLRDVVERSGGHPFDIRSDSKTIYHAATVFVCNYLVALMEVGLRCFDRAAVSPSRAKQIMQPIVRGTVENLFALGPAQALTGPIARGEASVIAKQLEDLEQWDQTVSSVYRTLGQVATELSREKGDADSVALDRIQELLRS